jgi:electron transport complex protein RnfG
MGEHWMPSQLLPLTSRAFLIAVNAAYQAYKAEGGEVNGVNRCFLKKRKARTQMLLTLLRELRSKLN